MSKGLIVGIAVAVVLAIAGMTGIAVADLNVESELQVAGNGSFTRDLTVQTEMGYAGKRLTETYYTRYMGTNGKSEVKYASSLYMHQGNLTGLVNETAGEIGYAQTAITTNAKQLVCSSNYDVGASQGFSANGHMAKSFETSMDDQISEFEIEAEVLGRARLMQKVVDPKTGIRHVQEDTRLDGRYDFEWSAYAEVPHYPAGDGGWLGCP